MKKLFIFMALLLFPCICSAWTLRWNPNTESDLAGYRVYGSADGINYTRIAEVTDECFPLDPSMEGSYFCLSAVDLAGNESAFSTSIRFDTAPSAPGDPWIENNMCAADVTKDGSVNMKDVFAFYGNFFKDFGRKDCIVVANEESDI